MYQPEKPLLNALNHIPSASPPIWLMRQAGRYLPEYRKIRSSVNSFLELCYNPELATEVTLQPIRRFQFDAAILFSDILVVPDALGMRVVFKEGEGPILEAVKNEKDIAHLHVEKVANKLLPVYDTVSAIKSKLPKEVTLIGFAGSPWTVATYMIEGKSSKDFSHAKTWVYKNPELLAKLIELLVDATVIHLSNQIKAGAEVIQLFDSWAGLLPGEYFRKWVIEPTKTIVKRIKSLYPHIPIIGFPRGASFYYHIYAEETGVDAVSFDQHVPLDWINENFSSSITVQGNLDPLLLLGNQENIREEVDNLLTHFKNSPFIFNLGHGIVPSTPIENVEFMIKTVRGL